MIEISNLSGIFVNLLPLKELAKNILKEENRERAKLNITLVKRKEIKRLNKKYRNKNAATDVLSFPAKKDFISPFEDLGEVIICPQEAFERDIKRVLIHGILHLLGYDHEKSKKEAEIMEDKSKQYL